MSERQAQPFYPKGQGWENGENEHGQQENQNNNANQQNDYANHPSVNNTTEDRSHQRSNGLNRQSGLLSQHQMFAEQNSAYPHHNRAHDRNPWRTHPNQYDPSGLFTWNRNGSNASSTSHARNSKDWQSHRSPDNNHGQHSRSQRDEQNWQDAYMLNRRPHFDTQDSNQTDDSITLAYGTENENSTLTSPAQPNQSHSDPGESPSSVFATSSTPLPQKPVNQYPSTISPQPSGESMNDTNLYAELDKDDDGGRKQSRWTNLNAQKTPKETIIDLVYESGPSRDVSGKIPRTSEFGGIAGLARAIIKAGETQPKIPNHNPLQVNGTSLPPPKKKQTNRKKANKRKGSPAIRRSARMASSTSSKTLSQSVEMLEAEPTEEGTFEEAEHQLFEPPNSNISIKKRKVKVIITIKYSKNHLFDSQEEEEDVMHESSIEAAESEACQSTVVDEDEISEAEMEIEDTVITNGDESVFTFNGKKFWHQTLACKNIRIRRSIPKCRPCTMNEGVPCLFQYTRAMPVCKNGELTYCLWNRCIFRPLQISVKEACLPDQNDFNRPMDSTTCVLMQLVCAKSLLLTLKKALQHSLAKDIVIRPREIQFRHYCDFCSTGLYASSYLCRKCGQEYCSPCQQKMIKGQKNCTPDQESDIHRCAVDIKDKDRYLHSAEDMLPVTRFSSEELRVEIKAMEDILHADHLEPFPFISRELDKIGEMEDWMESSLSDLSDRESSPATTEAFSEPQSGISEAISEDCRVQTLLPFHEVTRFQNDTMNEEQFVDVWSQGVPLVVSNVAPQLTWDPNAFQERYGDMECTVIRNDEAVNDQTKVNETVDYSKKLTVHDFFETFSMDWNERQQVLGKGNWKLKDWPPAAELQTSFPDLYKDFNNFVPMPDHTRRDGCKNLSSLFAKNANTPDLGPKMYNAWPGDHKEGGQGTTKLHMDIADAVNVLLFASEDLRIVDGHKAAQWDIFRAEDANKIRAFLRKHFDTGEEDPIHSQKFFLDDHLLQKLYAEKGVYSWRILQRQGEAVFIPAGCAHQVCNLTDCIKIAVDFLSPYNIERCFKLTEEFRKVAGEDVKSWKEDVLQLHSQLWYAWCTCKKLAEEEEANQNSPKSK